MNKQEIRQKVASYLEVAYIDDYDLNNTLAEHFLEPLEYYLYCKECEEDRLESVYETLEEDFVEYLEKNPRERINVRRLVERIYDLKVA